MNPFMPVLDRLRGFGNPARIAVALLSTALVASALCAPAAAQATEGGLLQGIAEGSAAVGGDDQESGAAPEEEVPAPEETAPAEETSAPEEVAPADGTAEAAAGAVQESGLSFELPEGVYFAEDEWWTYLDDTSALYFRTAQGATEGPDVTLGAPDDTWGTAQAEEEGYEYLGAVGYANETVSFYSYFYLDQQTAENPYVDFKAYVPLSDGSTSYIYGFARGDTDAMLSLIDAVLLTVEEGDAGAPAASTAPAGDVTCGAFTFDLPDDIAFELATADDGSILGTFPGPEDTCEVMFFSFETEGVTVTSTEELQQVGDAFMSGVEEGAAIDGGRLLDGGVFSNDQGIAYYQGTYISSEADALFALLPYGGEMTVVAIFDSGSTDDFSCANETVFAIADSSRLAETPAPTSGVPADTVDLSGDGTQIV